MSIEKDNIFSKRNTNIVKGVAALILCWHHLFWHNVPLPIDLKTVGIMDALVPLTKVCVALFTILSGYGICESFRNGKTTYGKFVFLHLKKLLVNYWWVYIPVFLLSFKLHIAGTPLQIYGTGIKGIGIFLLDFFGLRASIYSNTLNNTWWYMEAAIIFYLCFPVFHRALNKFSVLLLGISALPILLFSVNIFWDGFITTDRELFYIFPFLVGMEMSRKQILNRLVILCKKNKKEFIGYSIVLVIIVCVLRTQVSLILDTFYAVLIIMLGIGIASSQNIIVKGLEFLGKHSMNIFLIHSMVYCYFEISKQFLGTIDVILVKYLLLVLISLGVSIVLESVKGVCRKRFKGSIQRR